MRLTGALIFALFSLHASCKMREEVTGPLTKVVLEENTLEFDVLKSNLGSQDLPKRTATGGVVHSILVVLSFVAFIGNGAFMIFVFWL